MVWACISAVICSGGIPGPLQPVIWLLWWYSDDRQAIGPIMKCLPALWAGATEGLSRSTRWPLRPKMTVLQCCSYPEMVTETIGAIIHLFPAGIYSRIRCGTQSHPQPMGSMQIRHFDASLGRSVVSSDAGMRLKCGAVLRDARRAYFQTHP